MARKDGIDKTGYDFWFTRNWFLNRNLPTFRDFIKPVFNGRPTTYLEIGVFEGMSMVWMLQKVLTSSLSKAVGIDPWLMTTKLTAEQMDEVRKRAEHNTAPYRDKCTLVRGASCEVLRLMCSHGHAGITKNSVDLCMIDGGHIDFQAYDDAVHCLRLLKPGGWLLFDDVENDIDKANHVKQGLALFLKEYGDCVEPLWKNDYMEAFRKR